MLETQALVADKLRNFFAVMSASEVAELFLSPFVEPELLVECTREPGPTLWIVNRSDVYDETLEALKNHPVEDMARRARDKLGQRHSTLTVLLPPPPDTPLEEIQDYEVEDVLGHPLAPFPAMLFFSHSLSPDHRASSALSLTRRLLEHAPQWKDHPELREKLSQRFGELLVNDTDPYVRSYAARIPLLSRESLQEAWKKEKNPAVRGRLLQNPATPVSLVQSAVTDSKEDETVRTIAALDRRLPLDLRREESEGSPSLRALIHRWFAGAPA